MRHLDLFSGIGGFALAAQTVWGVAYENVGFCDNDTFCQMVLKKHWPQAKIYGDIKKLKGADVGAVDLVTGGFPCQPFSGAGKRRGTKDYRDLWPEMFRAIQETKPTWVIGENVAGFVRMELGRTITDLESAGYEVQSFIIPAVAVGANHRRDRVWIIGYSERAGRKGRNGQQELSELPTEAQSQHGSGVFIGRANWQGHCSRIRERDGIPRTMARPAVKAYGNAIVPQVAIQIMKAIKEIDMNEQLSNCCREEIKAITSDEGTCFYQCTKCLQACDVYVAEPRKHNPQNKECPKNCNIYSDVCSAHQFGHLICTCPPAPKEKSCPRCGETGIHSCRVPAPKECACYCHKEGTFLEKDGVSSTHHCNDCPCHSPAEKEKNPRMFTMIRKSDETGISGTGRVLDGILFVDGTVAIHWRTKVWSVTFFPDFNSFAFLHIKSHPTNGTELIWL